MERHAENQSQPCNPRPAAFRCGDPAVRQASVRAHTSIAGGMHKALEIGLQLGCDVVQVFVKNQRQWRASPLRADDLQHWLALLSTPGFGPAVAHATYLINLASADELILAQPRRVGSGTAPL